MVSLLQMQEERLTGTVFRIFFTKIFQSYADDKAITNYADFIDKFFNDKCCITSKSFIPDITCSYTGNQSGASKWLIVKDDNINAVTTPSVGRSFGNNKYVFKINSEEFRVNSNLGEIDIYELENIVPKDYTLSRYFNKEPDNVAYKFTDFGRRASFAPKTTATGGSITYFDLIDSSLKISKQIIMTGAPGTGKTYNVIEYVKSKITDSDQMEFVQFHPSYDYSDFVEGLRPVTKKGDDISFVKLDGVFKAFCRKIVESNLELAYPRLKLDDDKTKKIDEIFASLKKNENNEQGSYENFDEGGKKYYFIIDEINRTDLSKVLGELMYGLEETYRGIKNSFKTQYSNLATYEIDESTGYAKKMGFDCFKNGFFIPKNLYIIGTMNDIDRGVETFDFALRRRFKWIEIKANDVLKQCLISMDDRGVWNGPLEFDALADRITEMNDEISKGKGEIFGLSEAYQIGHSYFKEVMENDPSDYETNLKNVFKTRIEPILREYVRGRKTRDIEELVEACRNKLLK